MATKVMHCVCGCPIHEDRECQACSCTINEPDDGTPTSAADLTPNTVKSLYTGIYGRRFTENVMRR